MARFSWKLSLVFLALAYFSGICCVAAKKTKAPTTTVAPTTAAAPTTTSTSNVTTAASNMTTTPSNMTTTPSNMTTTPSNMTTAPSNMTTSPSNMTTAPSNMTTAPSNMTTAPSNMTTAPSNMTTAPSNMTTAPSNMTTAPSNMTTAPSNMTTAPSNMTTTSTTLPVTTSAPEPRWKVKNKAGKLCMLMDFDGTITDIKHARHVKIPPTANITKSSCESAYSSQFVVEFSAEETSFWQLILNFTMAKHSYKLSKMTVNLYVDNLIVTHGSDEEEFFTVPSGDFYKCDSLNATFAFQVNLTMPTFQPFVQQTKGKDNLGKECQCTNGSSVNHTNIIIGIVIAIIVLAAAVGVTYYVVKRRGTPSDPPYARVN